VSSIISRTLSNTCGSRTVACIVIKPGSCCPRAGGPITVVTEPASWPVNPQLLADDVWFGSSEGTVYRVPRNANRASAQAAGAFKCRDGWIVTAQGIVCDGDDVTLYDQKGKNGRPLVSMPGT
jgi:hypothetical protein